ncbi:vanadium-dependent haloperoxidase [Deinococcus yunweiensis]|uniref:vanadium-dependent haloperoxidase n=1 Tax=Deinococcus yunweiensis TaxID=367282 RepID=UPI00398F091B
MKLSSRSRTCVTYVRFSALGGVLTATLTSCPCNCPPPPPPPACTLSTDDWAQIEAPAHSQARVWNELTLHAIRNVLPQPTVHARNLYHVSAAMYDVWAATDPVARGVFSREKVTLDAAGLDEAINHAAHRVLRARFAATVPDVALCFDQHLTNLGLDPAATGTQGTAPAAVGNRIAQTVLDAARADGSNEAGGYRDTSGYVPRNAPLRPELPGATPADPDHWQPLLLRQPFTQNGIPQQGPQIFMGAHWGDVTPFAMTRAAGALYHDPGPAPRMDDPRMAGWITEVLRRQAQLDDADTATVNLSPGVTGNNPLGTDDGTGHPLNPATGQPYAPDVVRRADYGRATAEYWADGPQAETPPGHWNVLANAVADDPRFQRRLGGSGPALGALEWDVRAYLALNGAMHDAAISAWQVKRRTDTARAVTLVRVLAARNALPPISGVTERQDGVTMVRAWGGGSRIAWRDPAQWVPYQASNFVSPSFPGFVSGHSTFSRAAAEVLTDLTGSAFFPGGLYEVTVKAALIDGQTFATPVHLQWATYFDAADHAGQSRVWGGIHLPPDDYAGRRIGRQIGLDAVALARRYFSGQGP